MSLSDCGSPITILTRTKDESENAALFQKIYEMIPTHVPFMYSDIYIKSVGVLPKDKFAGKFLVAWEAVFEHANKIDFTSVISTVFSQKGLFLNRW